MPRIRAVSVEAHHDLVWSELAEAVEDLLGEADFDAISLTQIAERSGVSRTAIYNYARTKDQLLAEVVRRASRANVDAVKALAESHDAPAASRMSHIVDMLLRAIGSNVMRVALGRYFTGRVLSDASEQALAPLTALLDEVSAVIEDGIARGEFRRVDDVALTVDLLGATVVAAARHSTGEEKETARLSANVSELILHALT